MKVIKIVFICYFCSLPFQSITALIASHSTLFHNDFSADTCCLNIDKDKKNNDTCCSNTICNPFENCACCFNFLVVSDFNLFHPTKIYKKNSLNRNESINSIFINHHFQPPEVLFFTQNKNV